MSVVELQRLEDEDGDDEAAGEEDGEGLLAAELLRHAGEGHHAGEGPDVEAGQVDAAPDALLLA